MPRKKSKKGKAPKKKKKIKALKLKTAVVKNKSSQSDNKSSTLNQDEKPIITKIKKQATEKKEYNVKDYVVYPKHGVGKIIAIEKATIGRYNSILQNFHRKGKLTLTVPINQQSNLRRIASINQINKCVSILKSKPKIKRTMWSRRAQEYDQKNKFW